MKLTDKVCKNAKIKEKNYILSDGGGLFLEVHKNGSKYWRMRYRFAGKQPKLSFGVYPEVSLADARKKRDKAKQLHIDLVGKPICFPVNLRQKSSYAPSSFMRGGLIHIVTPAPIFKPEYSPRGLSVKQLFFSIVLNLGNSCLYCA